MGLNACVPGASGTPSCSIDERSDDLTSQQVLAPLLQCAGITPADTYRVDLSEAILRSGRTSWTPEELRQALNTWRDQASERDQWQFLLHNPGDDSVVAPDDLQGWRQLLVELWRPDASFPEQYWLNADDEQVAWASAQSVLGVSNPQNSAALTSDVIADVTVLLDDTLPDWSHYYPEHYSTNGETGAYTNWSITVCRSDSSLSRYSSNGQRDNAPADLGVFVERLQAIIDR
ncbi:MAG: hypothetical protein LBV30_08440 [Propionibacteriaceae bacterium]|nr:hypothetical protein [Propionibacteriaceae bacterium]